MSIRVARPSDLPTIAALEAESFAEAAWTRSQWEDELHAGRTVLVLESDGQLDGYASAGVVGDDAELLRIAVSSRCRRQGHGRNLLTAVVEATARCGAGRLLLEVDSENQTALTLYARNGFAPVARRRGYYRGRDAIVMERALR